MYSDPNMSDTTLLVSVEDLINRAMGPPDVNIVNFKLIQMVLQILARQQRMLNQRVEIKVTELAAAAAATPPHKGLEESTESSSSKSPRHPERGRMAEIKEEREKDEMAASLKQKALEEQKEKERAERIKLKAEKQAQREQEKAGKVAQREQEKAGRVVQREQEKAERAAQREQEKAGRAEQREQEKAGKTALKEQEKAERTAQKEQEKAEKLAQKEQEKAEKLEQKEQERAGKKAEKEQGKAERAAMKEQEKAEKSAMKEQEKAERSAMKEQEKAAKSAMKEQEKAEKSAMKEQEKAEKSAMKEQEKAERSAMKEQEKAEKSAMKEQEKAEKSAMKEQEKAEKSAMKEQEKAEKAALKEQEKAQKGQEKAERREQLEKEKGEKQALKEKERLLKETEKVQKEALKAEKETEKEKKRSAKEQEKAEKEKARAEKEEERARSRSKSPAESKKGKKDMESLSITETMRGQESVIVVEKGPTTRSDSRSRTNIDVVTQSQFALLDAAVRQLKEVAVPQPLAMPDNEKLRSDLAKGTASLPDTMQAMQVGARVKAAETAIERMTGLLTQLAAAGALPDHVAEQVESAAAEAAVAAQDREPFLAKSHASVAPKKSVLIDPKLSQTTHLAVRPSAHSSVAVTPRHSMLSRQSTVSMGPGVTHEEMNTALKDLREDLSKNLQGVVGRAAVAADSALHTAMNVANKLDVALKLDVRISSLFTLVSDYAEQLSGFDAGLTTQMQSFKDQIGQMRTDLKSGLAQLENVNNNAETAAVMELTERYTELVGELDTTLSAHNSLQRLQGQLGDEMHSLVECVEMLREQKCDRDEVLDGLRDKADISRLSGLLSESQFAAARSDFERRLDLCHDKFRRQDGTWTTAVKDLSRLTDQKAELIELLSLRDHTERQLQELHDRLRVLAVALGEPKAALLTRMMSRGASCGACGTAALMEPQDAQAGAPPRLPPLRPQPEPEPCTRWVTAEPPLDRHTCHRWVGGSHTLLPVGGSAGRETAATAPSAHDKHRTHKYTGYGDDGRLYMMEEDLKPCIECNMLSTSDLPQPGAVAESGAGDVQNCTPMDS